jgi:hypothetical protein
MENHKSTFFIGKYTVENLAPQERAFSLAGLALIVRHICR